MRRLIRFDHERCQEWDCAEFMFAPEGWTNEQIYEEANKVAEELIADAREIANTTEVKKPSYNPNYGAYPDSITIKEAKERHAKEKEDYEAWKKKNSKLTRSFYQRMYVLGFRKICDLETDSVFNIYWGHNHGLSLNYGDRERYED